MTPKSMAIIVVKMLLAVSAHSTLTLASAHTPVECRTVFGAVFSHMHAEVTKLKR